MTNPVRLLVAVLATLGVAVAAAPPASAHEGPGILTFETDTPSGTSHRMVVRLVWENDGHPAARETTITATPVGPDAVALTPVAMTPVDDDGRFEATVDLARPGAWTVRVTAINPSGTIEVPVDVAAPATTTTAPATTTTEQPATTDPAEEPVDVQETAAQAGDDGGLGAGVIVAGVVALLAVVAAGVFVVRSRRHPTDAGAD
ncbi:MAG TPA: hypothetical protein VK611_11245 [Acidimicrobiales bacterium]|nr:hypothetical protein [Acidimicrobiales bacterium]